MVPIAQIKQIWGGTKINIIKVTLKSIYQTQFYDTLRIRIKDIIDMSAVANVQNLILIHFYRYIYEKHLNLVTLLNLSHLIIYFLPSTWQFAMLYLF